MQPLDPFTMPLDGRRLIEASAGTGKTWTLTLLVLRLILEHGLGIEQILVLTYTRAATAELRSRIRMRLRETQQQLDGKHSLEDPDLAKVLACVDPETARLRLHQALTRMDEASVFTIHGFCQKVIQEHAVEAGFAFDQEILVDESELCEAIVADFWRNHFYPLGPEESALVAEHWPAPKALLNAIRGTLMVEEECVLPHLPADALRRQTETVRASHGALARAWEQHQEEAGNQLANDPCLSRSEKNYRKDQVQELLAGLDELLASDTFPRLLPKKIKRLCAATMRKERNKVKKVCQEWQPHFFFTVFEQFWQAYQQMLCIWKIVWLHKSRHFLHENLRSRKAQKRLLSYDDLLRLVEQALHQPVTGPQLAQALRNRYQAVLVDEFQDTDPVQYRIFSAICADASHPFFMIGDPKQAIYSFRGGDIFTYMQAKQDTAAGQRYTMASNHRSAPGMIAAVNTLFHRCPKAFVFAEDIPFHPVQAGGKVHDEDCLLRGAPPAPLNVLLFDQKKDQTLSRGSAEQIAAEISANAIRHLLQLAAQGEATIKGRPLVNADIAVLVYSHSQAELMRNALQRFGMGSVYAGNLSVFASREAEELELVLRAVLNPNNRAHHAEALATSSFFGLNSTTLYTLQQDASLWSERLQYLLGYQTLWQRHGINAMLHRLLKQEQVCSRLSALPDGERRLTNLLHLADLLHEEERNAAGMEALFRRLKRLQAQAETESEESRLMRLESDQALIRISTQHAAKGLEYPMVVLPFLWRSQVRNRLQEGVIAFHEREGLRACRDFDHRNEAHLILAEEEKRAEEMRLLYVALTRARHSTLLCWGRVLGMMDTPMARLLHRQDVCADDALLRQDLAQLNKTEEGKLVHCFSPAELFVQDKTAKDEHTAVTTPLAARSFLGQIPQGYTSCSYTSLSSSQEASPALEEGADELAEARTGFRPLAEDFRRIATFPRGTQAGICLHAMLEKLDFTQPVAAQQELVQQQLELYGYALHWLPAVVDWLSGVLATPLPASRNLAGLAEADQLRELNFLFPVENLSLSRMNQLLARFKLPQLSGSSEPLQGLMKGFVDLVFRHQGRFYIVDYKSNYLGSEPGSYSAGILAAAMQKHYYHLQYLLYTLALHRHLQLRMPHYRYNEHFGGVYYLFLRGMEPGQEAQGIYHTRPEPDLIRELDALCAAGATNAEAMHATP